MKSLEASGATIDDAIQKALKELEMDRDDVTVEVLEKPKSGFLGLGSIQAKVKVYYEATPAPLAINFVKGILDRFGVEAEIEAKTNEEEKTIYIELKGPDMGLIIGRRGGTLNAIQYLTSLVVNKNKDTRYRVIIDTENYREKREEALISLAKKMAKRVERYHRPATLEPMNPYERRIIHSALQNENGVYDSLYGS